MKASVRAALCGILSALAVVILMSVAVVPVMLYCAPILSGLCVAIAGEEFGWKYTFGVYAAASFLSLLLVADKETVCVFVLLSGAFTVLKYILNCNVNNKSDKNTDKFIDNRIGKFIVKLAYINLACVSYYFAAVMLLGVPKDSFGGSVMLIVFLIAGNIVMLAYDKAIDGVIAVYKIKFRKHIMKGKW